VIERSGRTQGRRLGQRAKEDLPPGASVASAGFADWPDTVRVVASQPSLWWAEPEPEPAALEAVPGLVRLGPEALVVGGELALSREIGQSFYLMGLLTLVLSLLVGLGLLAVRMLV
jgi:hypothetical protein